MDDATGTHERAVITGDTVHRGVGYWTPAVHALLRHLDAVGFAPAPRVLGFDAAGREMLSYIRGDAGPASWQHIVPDGGLQAYARLLRAYHDAVSNFRPHADAIWAHAEGPPTSGEIICHGDFGPWNVVWRDGAPVGIIDWDDARPAPALDDVAYALEYAAPFRDDPECLRWLRYDEPPDRRARIAIFAEAYGLASTDGLVDRVIAMQRSDIERVRLSAERGVARNIQWVAEGFLHELAARVEWSERNRHLFD